MTTDGWRSEPPDSAGWWEWRRDKNSLSQEALIKMHNGVPRQAHRLTGELHRLPNGGQWRKVPE